MVQVGKKVRDRRQKCGLYALQWRRTGRFQRTCASGASTKGKRPRTCASKVAAEEKKDADLRQW